MNNIIKNLKYFLCNFILLNILKFLLRIVFIKTLSIEYLGINSLLLNILATLSLAEIGVGPAIIYSLYKPLACKDKVAISAIMYFFRKLYFLIGVVILILGLVIYPWINNFIKDGQTIPEFNYYYLLFLANTVISYFWSYKRSIFIADQKQYVVNKYQVIIQTFVILLQILFLYVFQNYWLFIIIMFLGTLIENCGISYKANKAYPYLNDIKHELDVEIKHQISKNIKAMVYHKFGGIIIFNSGNLVLSKFVGIIEVGLYSNYFMIITALNNFAGKFFEAIIASIGNLIVTKNNEDKKMAFKLTEFITALQANVCFCGLTVLFNPLIEIWIGREFLFDENIIIAMSFSFYLIYMRKALQVFHDAAGLYWNDRYKPIVESIVNLVFSIYLTRYYGVIGVVFGSIISTLSTSFWVEPYVLFNNGIDIKLKDYFMDYLKFTAVALLSALASKFIYSSLFDKVTFVNFIAGIFICVGVTFVLWYVIFRNREEMRYLVQLAKSKFVK